VDQILDRALGKEPDQRFPTCADFAKYLRVMISKLDQVKSKVSNQAQASKTRE